MEVITTEETNSMLALNTAENGTWIPEFHVGEHETWDIGRWKQWMSTYYNGDYDNVWSFTPCAPKNETDDLDDAWSISANAPESDFDDTAPYAFESGITDHDDAWSTTANASESDLHDTAWWSEPEDSYQELLRSFSNTALYPSPCFDPYEEIF